VCLATNRIGLTDPAEIRLPAEARCCVRSVATWPGGSTAPDPSIMRLVPASGP